MHADLILIVLAAAVILAIVYRGLAWVYLPPRNLPGPAPDDTLHGAGESSSDVMDEGTWVKQFTNGIETPWVRTDEDDEWADQLHEINQLGKFGDLTRPVAHLTHYEVEALIRTLAVPEWVPDRYRMAA